MMDRTAKILSVVATGFLAFSACSGGGSSSGVNFTDIQNDIQLFGKLFGTENQTQQSVASIQSGLADVKNNLKPAPAERTAAVLIISGDKLNVYGGRSMSHTQFGLLGLHNIFSDVDKRIFDFLPFAYSAQSPVAVDGLQRLADGSGC